MRLRSVVLISIFFLVIISCKQKKKYHDLKDKEKVAVDDEAITSILSFQRKMNAEFKDPERSPLPDKYRKDFEGLDFFAPDTSYVIKAKFLRTPQAIPFVMPTTTDRTSEEVVYGIAHFKLNGEDRQLEVYQTKELMTEEGYEDYLFLPFTDLTNGEETYGGGRYLDLSIPQSDILIIDFNRAYNPYCVYNKKYSCPLVPSVNHLNTEVRAGIKAFKKEN